MTWHWESIIRNASPWTPPVLVQELELARSTLLSRWCSLIIALLLTLHLSACPLHPLHHLHSKCSDITTQVQYSAAIHHPLIYHHSFMKSEWTKTTTSCPYDKWQSWILHHRAYSGQGRWDQTRLMWIGVLLPQHLFDTNLEAMGHGEMFTSQITLVPHEICNVDM